MKVSFSVIGCIIIAGIVRVKRLVKNKENVQIKSSQNGSNRVYVLLFFFFFTSHLGK